MEGAEQDLYLEPKVSGGWYDEQEAVRIHSGSVGSAHHVVWWGRIKRRFRKRRLRRSSADSIASTNADTNAS
jgi:hypothetical protein